MKYNIGLEQPPYPQKWTYCQLGSQILSWKNGHFGVFFALPQPKKHISCLQMV